jgi:CheY-like chemotaxis protein
LGLPLLAHHPQRAEPLLGPRPSSRAYRYVGKAIRSSKATANIPILIQTALPEWQVREWFSDYDAYLQKPFDVPPMLDVIADLLRGKAAAVA